MREVHSHSIYERFLPLFRPKVMAVVGASASGVTPGNEFIRHSRSLGFSGRIVPIHPTASLVEGLPTAASFSDVGAPVDLAYIAVKAQDTPALIASGAGVVRFAQVMSSGFGETADGQELEHQLVHAARVSGVRLLGPNCLGVYSPGGKISFIGDSSGEEGHVGVITQSGGLGADVVLRGKYRGLRYSAVVTIGNSVDIGPTELLEYFLVDPDTKVVGLYAEDIKDGRAFYQLLRRSNGAKPIVVLLGGQTKQGKRAAASHTGSLVSSIDVWRGLSRQTGTVIVQTLDEFLDVLLAFQTLEPRHDHPTSACVLFGNGGGASVLAADAFDRRGLVISSLPAPALQALEALQLPPGTSVQNPIDTPTTTLRQQDGNVAFKILNIVLGQGEPDAVVMHLNLPMFTSSADQRVDFLRNLISAAMRARSLYSRYVHFLLVLRSDGSELAEMRKREFRGEAVGLGIPVYDEIVNAVSAIAGLAHFERYLIARRDSSEGALVTRHGD